MQVLEVGRGGLEGERPDSGGGGGDCGGGGGDCNIAAKHPGALRGRVTPTVVWAFLPLPFAVIAIRRARRRQASSEPADGAASDGEVGS